MSEVFAERVQHFNIISGHMSLALGIRLGTASGDAAEHLLDRNLEKF